MSRENVYDLPTGGYEMPRYHDPADVRRGRQLVEQRELRVGRLHRKGLRGLRARLEPLRESRHATGLRCNRHLGRQHELCAGRLHRHDLHSVPPRRQAMRAGWPADLRRQWHLGGQHGVYRSRRMRQWRLSLHTQDGGRSVRSTKLRQRVRRVRRHGLLRRVFGPGHLRGQRRAQSVRVYTEAARSGLRERAGLRACRQRM